MSKHTPGPWHVQDDHGKRWIETGGNDDTIAEIHRRASKGSVYSCKEAAANARLIAAAPRPLASMVSAVENAEQRAFEDWLQRVSPSGDAEAVHDQWSGSTDYLEFTESWAEQLDAIDRAQVKP